MTAARQYVAGADPRQAARDVVAQARLDGLVQRYGGTCTLHDEMPQGRKAVRWDGPNGEQVELVAPTVGEAIAVLGRALAIHTTQQG